MFSIALCMCCLRWTTEAVLSLGQLQPFTSAMPALQVWCLDSQISHKVQLLRNHILGPDKAPVVVIAHSIGSYIMLQAIKQLEGELTDAAEPALAEALKKQLPKVSVAGPVLGSHHHTDPSSSVTAVQWKAMHAKSALHQCRQQMTWS